MVTSEVERDPQVVIPEAPTPREAGVTLAELLSSFYLWLVLWLVLWAAVPALLIGWEPVLITSGSMGPNISAGDLVLISEPAGDELLAQGTVITFDDPVVPGGLITHRIDGVREDGMYRTRGDANEAPDPTPVAHEDVVGVGRLLVPLVGLPIHWLRVDVVSFGLFMGGTLAAAVVAGSTHRAGRRREVGGGGAGEATDHDDAASTGAQDHTEEGQPS